MNFLLYFIADDKITPVTPSKNIELNRIIQEACFITPITSTLDNISTPATHDNIPKTPGNGIFEKENLAYDKRSESVMLDKNEGRMINLK